MALTMLDAKIIDRNDKISLFNAINKTDFCFNALFCSQCDEWLMAPIYTKSIGVHICARCYSDNDTNDSINRNGKLEALLAMYQFPCTHFNNGCPIKTNFKEIREHERTCKVHPQNMRKYLHCCTCQFQTSKSTELIRHFKDVHKVSTIQAKLDDAYNLHFQFEEKTRLLIVELASNLFVLKASKESKVMICDASGSMPQFKIQLRCKHMNVPAMLPVHTNLNQLKLQGHETNICSTSCYHSVTVTAPQCRNLPLGCLGHSDRISCSYGLINCCEQSFSAIEYCQHIKDKHGVINRALIKRNMLNATECHYISVDENVFRFMHNTLTKLYWFGGHWQYSVYVLLGDVVTGMETLDLAEVHELPLKWDTLYISRSLAC